MTARIDLRVNGSSVSIEVEETARLLDLLRDGLALRGAKDACSQGSCGACCVLLDGLPVNACLVLAVQARGGEVRTIEGCDAAPLRVLLRAGATQCGFCSPGVAQTVLWIAEHPELLDAIELEDLLAGHLCRCTGYRGILEGARRVVEARRR